MTKFKIKGKFELKVVNGSANYRTIMPEEELFPEYNTEFSGDSHCKMNNIVLSNLLSVIFPSYATKYFPRRLYSLTPFLSACMLISLKYIILLASLLLNSRHKNTTV